MASSLSKTSPYIDAAIWPVVTSNDSVSGDVVATYTVANPYSASNGLAVGLTLSQNPGSYLNVELGAFVYHGYVCAMAAGKVVAVAAATPPFNIRITRTADVYRLYANNVLLYERTGAVGVTWLSASFLASSESIDNATLTGTGPGRPSAAAGKLRGFKGQAYGGAGAGGNVQSRLIGFSGGGYGEAIDATFTTSEMTTPVYFVSASTMGVIPAGVVTPGIGLAAATTPWTIVLNPVASVVSTIRADAVLLSAAGAAVLMISSIQALCSLSLGGSVEALMFSTLSTADSVHFAGEGNVAWAVNAETGASSMYEGYDFNSFGAWQGSYLAARNDGLYLLEGDSDAGQPIRAEISFGTTDFGTPLQKTVQYAYIGVSSAGNMFARITVEGKAYTYRVRRNDPTLKEQRIDFGRGLKATHVTLELLNENGADFELSTVEFNTAVLSRRI